MKKEAKNLMTKSAFLFVGRAFSDRHPAQIQAMLGNPPTYWVLEKNEVIAFCRAVTDWYNFAHILDVYVGEDHRHQGVGKQLVKFALRDLAFAPVVTLSTRKPELVRWYARNFEFHPYLGTHMVLYQQKPE